MLTERRHLRSPNRGEALAHQLAACRAGGQLDAIVVADRDGLVVAGAGDAHTCEALAVAALSPTAAIAEFSVDGSPLRVHAAGGTPAARVREMVRAAAGAARILAR